MENFSVASARRSLATTVVVLGAILGPASAWADDGSSTLPSETVLPAVSDALAEARDALGEADVEAITDAVVEETLDPLASLPTEPDRETVADPSDIAAAADGENTAKGAVPGDTATPDADTAGDTSASASASAPETGQGASPPSSVAVAVQAGSGNLNVSVRIASPGDNGTVEQTSTVRLTTETERSADTAPDAGPSGRESVPSPAAVSTMGSPPVSPTGSEPAWIWQWDCLSAPPISLSPSQMTSGIAPSNWIWYWNCSANSAQYQPVNVNVGIRVASPGSDGPVTQTSVVVVTQTPAVVVTVGAGPDAPQIPVSPGPVETSGAGFGPIAAPEVRVEFVPAPELPAAVVTIDGGVQELPPAPEAEIAPSHGPLRFFPGLPLPTATTPALDGRRIASRSLRKRNPGLVIGRIPIVPLVTKESSQPGGNSPSARAKAIERASHWRLPEPRGTDIGRVSSGATVTPAGPGGSASSGLPLFLALPFLAAVLDMARRLALERVATPSGHRSRIPHDPG